MNVYQKLNAARKLIHEMQLKKTGKNPFAKYSYFELGDFLDPALKVFDEVGLCGIITFNKEMATLHVVDVDVKEGGQHEVITFTSPMGSADMKGTLEIQQIGAVETYQRRYLWMAALEIVENDAIDSSHGAKTAHKPTDGAKEALTPELQQRAHMLANGLVDAWNEDDMEAAKQIWEAVTDNDVKVAAWSELGAWSKERAAFKKYLKGEANGSQV